MQYAWSTPIGTWWIRRRQSDDRWEIWWKDNCFGSYHSPAAAASDVYAKATGNSEWDMQQRFSAPEAIRDWHRTG